MYECNFAVEQLRTNFFLHDVQFTVAFIQLFSSLMMRDLHRDGSRTRLNQSRCIKLVPITVNNTRNRSIFNDNH